MRLEVTGIVEAPLADAWAWWTDFGAVGDAFRVRHGLGASRRTILERGAGRVVFEDRALLGTVRREIVFDGAHAFDEDATGGQTFQSRWTFEADGPARTRVRRTMRIKVAAPFRPFARWVSVTDLRYHCREATRALRGAR